MIKENDLYKIVWNLGINQIHTTKALKEDQKVNLKQKLRKNF